MAWKMGEDGSVDAIRSRPGTRLNRPGVLRGEREGRVVEVRRPVVCRKDVQILVEQSKGHGARTRMGRISTAWSGSWCEEPLTWEAEGG